MEDRTVPKNLTLQYDQVLFIREPNEIDRWRANGLWCSIIPMDDLRSGTMV